jgi:acyl-CoA dehydrogenase
MDFSFDERTADLHEKLTDFMAEHIYPAEPSSRSRSPQLDNPWTVRRSWRSSSARRDAGLWNLFLPDRRSAPA